MRQPRQSCRCRQSGWTGQNQDRGPRTGCANYLLPQVCARSGGPKKSGVDIQNSSPLPPAVVQTVAARGQIWRIGVFQARADRGQAGLKIAPDYPTGIILPLAE